MRSEKDDAHLVMATLGGENEAFGELARRYRKAAFGIAFSRTGDYDTALDVAQEALVTAYLQLPVLRDPRRFAAWLYQIAANLALMGLRRHRRLVSLDSPDLDDLPALGPSPLETAEKLDQSQAIREALARLPETDRLAVVLHHLSGYSYEEIAGMLGISVSAVKTRIYRARKRLREEMLDEMKTLGDELPPVEVDEELLDRVMSRHDAGDYGMVAHLAGYPGALPGMPRYTEKTKDAVHRIADRLRKEGYSWLYAPVHLPEGSPALPIFRSLGFQIESELGWYERDLATKLPSAPPLEPGFEVRRLQDATPQDFLALVRSTTQKHSPDAVDLEWARRRLENAHTVREASSAAYREGRLVAHVCASGVTSWENWKYEPGTAVLWATWDLEIVPDSVLAYLIATSLRALKQAGIRRAVMDCLNPDLDYHRVLIPALESLGFQRLRSQWNLKLRLNPECR